MGRFKRRRRNILRQRRRSCPGFGLGLRLGFACRCLARLFGCLWRDFGIPILGFRNLPLLGCIAVGRNARSLAVFSELEHGAKNR
ncbi:hypothetical protein D3C87_1649970 [compost metagenome]